MSNMNDERLRNKKANEAAKRAAELLTPSQNYAIAIAGKNVKCGAFWGFTTLSDVKEYYKAIASDKNMQARKIADSCIIEVNPKYIVESISAVDSSILSRNDYEHIQKNMSGAVVEFEKFLVNKGITTPNFQSTICIYSINNVSSVSYKGVSYPAFRLNLEKTMTILAQFGYMVKVGGSYVSAKDAVGNIKALWESLKLSPTKTGVFMNIKSTLPPEQLKVMKKSMKNSK